MASCMRSRETVSTPETKCPENFTTTRLLLRRPTLADAEPIFSSYAGDAAIGRYLCWPIHQTVDDTIEFLRWSDEEWSKWPGGPYLIVLRETNKIIGGTGLTFEDSSCAMTGYVLAKRYWGMGYATEALQGITEIARTVPLKRLYALCHCENEASLSVLRKGGFRLEEKLEKHCKFPNMGKEELQDVLKFVWSG